MTICAPNALFFHFKHIFRYTRNIYQIQIQFSNQIISNQRWTGEQFIQNIFVHLQSQPLIDGFITMLWTVKLVPSTILKVWWIKFFDLCISSCSHLFVAYLFIICVLFSAQNIVQRRGPGHLQCVFATDKRFWGWLKIVVFVILFVQGIFLVQDRIEWNQSDKDHAGG